ncbi:GIY-YIG nuclease family protein [Arthrobacter wenxiniae]|uniref:GIY-YIG catalytic domain-containing protein n=1 Tax=Arthrobacter wenxiniae TaxID=2713570 RepID=A0A7Y7LZN5_9MICC|nr:hypothetical protein [Arthrobacter wenxiniae]NVM96172.1 hypothetical protein [Arthrobacter wenxiniae]
MSETLTLHVAIERILADAGRSLTTREIADAVNAHGLYARADGQPVPTSQVSARLRKYPALFNKVGNQMSLVVNAGLRPATSPRTQQPPQTRRPNNGTIPDPVSGNMSIDSAALLNDLNYRLAGDVVNLVPEQPGVYAIRVVDVAVLPEPFRVHAERRNDRLIYIGEAKISLRKRLGQELWATGHGTFFRSIGAVIGHRPMRGSLAGMANKHNYTFAPAVEVAIIRWINLNLEVSWLAFDREVHETEVRLIHEFGPLLNLSGNPRKLPELSVVREELPTISCSG